MMKMRRAKTTKFRDLVPKSAELDDLLIDLEKGKKSSDDYGDLSGSLHAKEAKKKQFKGERVVDFPRQATLLRR